ncbi:hypothetical protein SprV_0802473300 [Sparganum proliferum]
MFHQLLLLILAQGVFGEVKKGELEFKQNNDYVYTKKLFGNVEYMTIDGVNMSNPENGSNCVAPNDCWQIVEPGRYVIANGHLKGTHAAITVEPVDFPNRSRVVVQYHKKGTQPNSMSTNESRPVLTKEIAENEKIIHILLFSRDIRNVNVMGNISTRKIDFNVISLLGKTGVFDTRAVLFTGHLDTTPRLVKIKFTTGREDHITITPSNKAEATVPMLTFIDYVHAFKLK